MTQLSKLKFSDKQRSQVKMTVEERLRHKLIDRLKEQKELAEPAVRCSRVVHLSDSPTRGRLKTSPHQNAPGGVAAKS